MPMRTLFVTLLFFFSALPAWAGDRDPAPQTHSMGGIVTRSGKAAAAGTHRTVYVAKPKYGPVKKADKKAGEDKESGKEKQE